jgi:hypothetical protein
VLARGLFGRIGIVPLDGVSAACEDQGSPGAVREQQAAPSR